MPAGKCNNRIIDERKAEGFERIKEEERNKVWEPQGGEKRQG